MINHIWSVVCLRVIVDHDTNNVSLIDVIEEITIQGPLPSVPEGKRPALEISLIIASLWKREPEDQPAKGQIRIHLFMPNLDAPTQVANSPIDLSGRLRLRTYGNSSRLPFAGPGTYRFAIQLQDEGKEEWKEVASIPLSVKMQEAKDPDAPETEKEKEL